MNGSVKIGVWKDPETGNLLPLWGEVVPEKAPTEDTPAAPMAYGNGKGGGKRAGASKNDDRPRKTAKTANPKGMQVRQQS